MNKLLFLAVGIVILSAVSCKKEIEYKGDAEDPQIVVNSILMADSTIRVRVERSRFFLDAVEENSDYWLTNAVVTLTNVTGGQVYVVSAADAEGYHVFPVTAQAGADYMIQVNHPDFPVATSHISVPLPVPILSIDTNSYQSDGVLSMKALVKWNDPAGGDYYVMKLSFKEMSSGNVFYGQPLSSNDPGLDELSSGGLGDAESYYQQLYFTDAFFDGQQKTMEIRFQQSFFQLNSNQRFQVHLYRCNEATYKYLISSRKAQYADGDFFSEPVKVFTNIENGYGIFGGMSETVFLK